jgi:hypothetical protein
MHLLRSSVGYLRAGKPKTRRKGPNGKGWQRTALAALRKIPYLVELVKAKSNSCHDDGQGTVISPSGTSRA